jgi:hypothetical protein
MTQIFHEKKTVLIPVHFMKAAKQILEAFLIID